MTLDAVCQFNASFADPEDLIYNASAEQVAGVGGSGGDYQAIASFNYPTNLTTGAFIGRFISNYDSENDTKSGILTEFGPGGWPLFEDVFGLGGAGEAGIVSASNLSASTGYTALFFWIGPDHIADWQAAINTTQAQAVLDAADAAGQLYPSGDAVIATNTVTIVGTTSAATSITFTGSVVTGAGAGTFIGTAVADRQNGTWSLVNTPPAWIAIRSQTGAQVTLEVASGQTAPSAGNVNFDLQYDNSAISGGSTYSDTMTVPVTADTGGATARYLPVPTVNANSNGQDLTLAEFLTLAAGADGGGSNWQSTMTTLGITTTGVDAVVSLAATDFNQDFLVQNIGPFTDGSNTRYIHVRGQGTFSRDAWTATTTGTAVNKLQIRNCEGLRFWLISAESTSGGYPHHQIINSEDVFVNRCLLHGDVARSASAAANRPNLFAPLIAFYGSTNVGIRQCTIVGTPTNVFNAYTNNGNTNGVLIEQCVFDQTVSDMVSFGNNNVNDNWTIKDLYWGGRVRAQGNIHPDICQFSNGSAGTGWLFESNFCGTTGWWGYKGNPSNKMIQSNSGSADQNATFTQNYNVTPTFMIDGVGYRHRNGSATYNTIVNTPDLLLSDESGEQGDILCRNGIRVGVGTVDYNFYMRDTSSVTNLAVGPNDEMVVDAGFVPVDKSGYDFSEMANWWEDYNVPASPVANVNQIRPSHRASTIWGHRPKTGSRLHWNHADPVGAYQWAERTFDATNHDNPYDWGWPTACQFRIAFDSGQDFPNATAANSFDANGDPT